MKATVDKLGDKLTEMIQSRDAFVENVDRDALKQYVGTLLTDQRNILGSLKEITANGAKLNAALTKHKDDKSKVGVQAYFAYKGRLAKHRDKRAHKAEEAAPLSGLYNAVAINVGILEELEAGIDKLFTHNTINLFNSRLSHVVVLGVIAESKLVYNYSRYMVSGVVSSITNMRDIARYRYAFMDAKSQDMVNIVSRAHSKTGSYNFKAMIKDLKSKSIDVTLLDDMNNITVNSIDANKIGKTTSNVMARGVASLNIFRWMGEMWETYKHNRAQQAKKEKEWMEAHVALLIMDLGGMDSESAEYKKLSKIISKYELMITEADRKQQDYEDQK